MAEKTLTEALGTGAVQDANTLTISKTGLATLLTEAGYSFIPKTTNSVDELMIAIICAGLVTMKPTDREADPANRNVEFSYDPAINYDSPTLDGQSYTRHTISVSLYKQIPTPKINPSDY